MKKIISLVIIFCLILSVINPALAWKNKDSYSDLRQDEFIGKDKYIEQFGKVICIQEAQELINRSENISSEFLWYLTRQPDYQYFNSGDAMNWFNGNSIPNNYPATFFEYPSSKNNAFALPGGFVFITSGLMDQFRNGNITEGEMAFLLSHEFTHARAGHGFSQRNTGLLAAIFMTAAYIFARNSDNKYVRQGVPAAAAIVGILILSGISQKDEKFADTVATRETMAMGYPADSGITLLQKIAGDTDITGNKNFDNRCYFKSHPDLDERIENITESAQNFDNSIYSYFPQTNQATAYSENNYSYQIPTAQTVENPDVTIIKINAVYNPELVSNQTPSNSNYNTISLTPPTTEKQESGISNQINPINSGYNTVSLTPPSGSNPVQNSSTTNTIHFSNLNNSTLSSTDIISIPFCCKNIKLVRTDSGKLIQYFLKTDDATINIDDLDLPSGTKCELTTNNGRDKITKTFFIK